MGTIIRELEALERLHEEFGFRYLELAQALTVMAQRMPNLRRTGPAPWSSMIGVTGPTHSAPRIRPRTLNPLTSHELSRLPMRAPIIDSRKKWTNSWRPATRPPATLNRAPSLYCESTFDRSE